MKKINSLLIFSLCTFFVYSQVPVKTAAKPVLTTSQSQVKTSSPVAMPAPINAASKLRFPSSWLRSDMNQSWVIAAGPWLRNGFTGFLILDKLNEPWKFSMAVIPQTFFMLYPLQVEDEYGLQYLTPIDLGSIRYITAPGQPALQIINVQDPANYQKMGWRIDTWGDGTFSLLNLRYNSYLALEKASTGTTISSKLISPASNYDPMNIKFILYGLSRTEKRGLSFYHPGTQSFLGLENNTSINSWINDPFDAQNRNTSKPLAKFTGISQPLTAWNFGDVTGSATSLREFAPGERFDMDGDGHRAIDAGGDDCDDKDATRFPGNVEKMDANGHDEDCDCNFELVDKDRDGHYDIKSFNRCNDGVIKSGDDCDDNNAAIRPGAMIYINETEVEICGRGKEKAAPGMKFIRELNGTARSVPK